MKDRIAIVIFGNKFNDINKLKDVFAKTVALFGINANEVIVIANDMKDNSLVEELKEDIGLKLKFQQTKWKDFNDRPCVVRTRKIDGIKYNYFAILNRNSKMIRFISKAEKKALIVVYQKENTNVSQLLRTARKYKVKIAKIKF